MAKFAWAFALLLAAFGSRAQPDVPVTVADADWPGTISLQVDARDTLRSALQMIHVHDSAANLEGSDGRVVFVLDDHVCPCALGKQGPRILWRRRHEPADDLRRGPEVAQRWKGGYHADQDTHRGASL